MCLKAIIMDIDGTLVDGKTQQIPPVTKKTLKELQEKGIQLVLASGRPINGMIALAKELEMDQHHGLCVCFNGAKVVDIEKNEVLFDQTMSVETGKAILRHMKNFDVRPLIVKDEYAYVQDVYDCFVEIKGSKFNIVNHEAHDNNFKLCEVDDLEIFADYPLNKILVIGESDYLKEHYQEMYEPFTKTCNAMFTAPFYYEYTDKGIDKVKALETVLNQLNISSENCISFGDAQNDIGMIKWAKVGIAMGNATEETKLAADEVTDKNVEEGIAHSLEKHFSNLLK